MAALRFLSSTISLSHVCVWSRLGSNPPNVSRYMLAHHYHFRKRCVASLNLQTSGAETTPTSNRSAKNFKGKKGISPKQLEMALQKRREEASKKVPTEEKEGPTNNVNDRQTSDKKSQRQLLSSHKKKKATTDNSNDVQTKKASSYESSLKKRQTKAKQHFKDDEEPNDYEIQMKYDIYRPEQELLINHIQERLDPNHVRVDLSPFKNVFTAPSVIGVSPADIDERLEQLLAVGFKEDEAARILPVLPFCMEIDLQAFHDLCRVLEEYDVRWYYFLTKELFHTLVQGSMASEAVRRNIEHLKKLGLRNVRIKLLLMNCPILFTSPLSESAVQTILETNERGFKGKWIESCVADALTYRPVKVSIGPNARQVNKILTSLTVNPDFIMKRYPSFFLIKDSQLYSILKVMSGTPLYLDTAIIASIITTCPQDIVAITDDDSLRKHLTSVKDLLSPGLSLQAIGAYLNRVPSLINPIHSVKERAAMLEELGFTSEEISSTIVIAPSILIHEEESLKQRMRLLLALEGSSPTAITTALSESAMFIRKPVDDITSRYNYTKKYKESLLHVDNLHKLFGSSDKQFSSLLDHNPIQYLEEAMKANWIEAAIASDRLSRLRSTSPTVSRRNRIGKSGQIPPAQVNFKENET